MRLKDRNTFLNINFRRSEIENEIKQTKDNWISIEMEFSFAATTETERRNIWKRGEWGTK